MWPTKIKWSLLCSLILILSCSKEELPINQANLDDLKYSYYKTAPNTIELSSEESKDLIISKSDEEITINTSNLPEPIQVGDVLASEWGTSFDDFLLRKVLSISSQSGDQATFETRPAGLVETYTEYYFNSKNEDVVRLRSSTMEVISAAATTVISSVISSLVDEGFLPFDVEPTLELAGEVNWEAIHPNTAYTIFCQSQNCNTSPSVKDSDNDGIWDVAESLFGAMDPEVENNGFFTLEFTEFSVKSYGLLLSKTLDGPSFNAQPTAEILQRLETEENIAETIDRDLGDNLALIFIPTPLAYPPFSITGVVSPFFDFSMEGSPYLDLSCIPNKTVTIQFGHINWNNFVPDPEADFRVYDESGDVNLTDLVLPADISYTAGFTGEITLEAGVGLGAALTVGEGNKSGASIGGLLKMGSYKTITGEVAVRVNDAANTSIFDGDISGSACLDIGFIHEPILFTDVNTPDGILGALFDYQISLPVPIVGDRTSLFAFAKEPVGLDNKLCLGEGTICQNTTQTYTNIAKDNFSQDNECVMEFKFSNNKVTVNDEFELTVVYGSNEKVVGTYAYNEDHQNIVLPIPFPQILEAIENNTLSVKIVDVSALCDRSFGTQKLGISDDCITLFDKIDAPSAIFSNLNLENIHYYKFEELSPLISNGLLDLPTEEELQIKLQLSACKNPVGILIDNSVPDPPYIKVNSHLSYYWVRNQNNQPIVLEAESSIQNGTQIWSTFKLRTVSESSYACLLFN